MDHSGVGRTKTDLGNASLSYTDWPQRTDREFPFPLEWSMSSEQRGKTTKKKSLRILCAPTMIDNAYPARIKHQCLRTLVLRDRLRCEPRSYGVNILVRYSRHVAKRLCTWERVNRCVSLRARLHRVYMHEIPHRWVSNPMSQLLTDSDFLVTNDVCYWVRGFNIDARVPQ